MYIYVRLTRRVGIGFSGILVFPGLLAWLVVWTVRLLILAAMLPFRLGQRRRQATRRQFMLTKVRADLQAVRDKQLAGAAPGPQRDEMRYWLDQAIPAYMRFLETRDQTAWLAFSEAAKNADLLMRVHVGACRTCGARNQLVGRACGYCSAAIPFDQPVGIWTGRPVQF